MTDVSYNGDLGKRLQQSLQSGLSYAAFMDSKDPPPPPTTTTTQSSVPGKNAHGKDATTRTAGYKARYVIL